MTRYRTIVADPPWTFESAATKADARKHYGTMTLSEIAALPVASMAEDDCHLWLWAVNGMMREAHEVALAWGFRPITLVTWCKPQPGVGYYLRNNTEHCIFATRGEPMVPETKPTSTWFRWPRGAHSSKPDAFYDLVETVSPGPYCEMFARRARLGDWSYWGNQSLGTADMERAA
jgi:N6-adenosine-specific RNA methylase IME4